MNFQYNYNLSGTDRKPLVTAVSQILGQSAVYQGAPSFAYVIGGCVVDRNGILSLPDSITPETARNLVEALHERGFTAENDAGETDAENSGCTESAVAAAETSDAITIEIPSTEFTPEALDNLRKIIASKETLLKQALEADSLSIIELEGKIAFPWFTLHGIDGEALAYSQLVAALCKMAKEQKRVTATEKPVENAKFTMRLFLIRLGFIGDEYKTARKILLKNLTGNSSWKAGHRPDASETDTGHTDTAEPSFDEKGGVPYARQQ